MFELNVKDVTMVEGHFKFHLISYNELPQLHSLVWSGNFTMFRQLCKVDEISRELDEPSSSKDVIIGVIT